SASSSSAVASSSSSAASSFSSSTSSLASSRLDGGARPLLALVSARRFVVDVIRTQIVPRANAAVLADFAAFFGRLHLPAIADDVRRGCRFLVCVCLRFHFLFLSFPFIPFSSFFVSFPHTPLLFL